MNDEKRRFTRISFKTEAHLEIKGLEPEQNRRYTVHELYNLSIGGCLVPLSADIEKGAECHVEIGLSPVIAEVGIHVEGTIIRSDSGMVAVKFIRIDPDSLFHLQNIVRYNSPDSEMVEQEIDDHPGII
jgi:hypothetical protein